MDFTSDDKHNMQLNPDHIPSPAVNERLSSKFHLPIFMDIAYESVLSCLRLYLTEISQFLSDS